jgi:hypothetical protein
MIKFSCFRAISENAFVCIYLISQVHSVIKFRLAFHEKCRHCGPMFRKATSGANPTIVSYNARVAKI